MGSYNSDKIFVLLSKKLEAHFRNGGGYFIPLLDNIVKLAADDIGSYLIFHHLTRELFMMTVFEF